MQYRKFGKMNVNISALGFGCMRFPIVNEKYTDIDEKEAIKLLRHAIDNGVNYIDTAYPYHGGNSELVVAKALKDGYRERVYLADKLPVWLVNSYEDFDKYLEEQLKKLDTDHIDMYLLHALDKSRFEKIKALKVFDFVDAALKSGKIKHIGFSFHDDIKTFKEIVDAYDWDFCQIQYNVLDINEQAGLEGLEYASSKGLAVIIMEPLKGGRLTKALPDEVERVYAEYSEKRSPADWCLSWVWNHPQVSLLLSGMGTIEQLEENLKIAEKALPNAMSTEELEIIDKVREEYHKLLPIGCTKCEYCMPCTAGINIPETFELYNNITLYKELDASKRRYNSIALEKRASACVGCSKCEEQCPQHLPIMKWMRTVHSTLKE